MHNRHARGRQNDPVQAIARYLLDERLDGLTDDALGRLMEQEPAYAALTMDADMRRRGMRRTLELALSRVASDSVPLLGRPRDHPGGP